MTRPLYEPNMRRDLSREQQTTRRLERRPAGEGCGDWTAVDGSDFQNDWENVGGPWRPLRYRLCQDDIEIEGLIQGGTDCTVVFTLPVDSRPSKNTILLGIDAGGQVLEWVVDATTGEVTVCFVLCFGDMFSSSS